MPPGQLRNIGPDVVRNDPDLPEFERVEKSEQVGQMHIRPNSIRRRRIGMPALPEAPEIGRDQVEAVGQALHHWSPGQPEFRPAMQQHQRFTLTAAGVVNRNIVDDDRLRRDAGHVIFLLSRWPDVYHLGAESCVRS